MNATIEKTLNPVKCVGMETVIGAPDLTIDHVMQARSRIASCSQHPDFDFDISERANRCRAFFKCENFQEGWCV